MPDPSLPAEYSLVGLTDPKWAARLSSEAAAMNKPKVQVLHERDSDAGCTVRVWVDGTEVTEFEFEDVNPGRGYTREDWDEQISHAQASVGVDDSTFPDAVVASLQEFASSSYVQD